MYRKENKGIGEVYQEVCALHSILFFYIFFLCSMLDLKILSLSLAGGSAVS